MDENGKKIVVDASVILAAVLPDERVEEVNRLFERQSEGEVDLVAPGLLIYEVWNSIKSAVMRKRLKGQDVKTVIAMFEAMGLKFINMDDAGTEVIKQAVENGLSGYDATYIVLARRLRCKLFSLDKKLMTLVE